MRNLLYKSTVLSAVALAGIACFGMSQPAWAQAYMPPFPGEPSATNSVETEVQASYCNQVGLNGWTPGGGTGVNGVGSGVSIEYGPPDSTNTYLGYYFVAECIVPTDLASCNAAVTEAINNLQPFANWFTSNHYSGVTTWENLDGYCSQRFGSGSGPGSGAGSSVTFELYIQPNPKQPSSAAETGTVKAFEVSTAKEVLFDKSYDQSNPSTPVSGYSTCGTLRALGLDAIDQEADKLGIKPKITYIGSCPTS